MRGTRFLLGLTLYAALLLAGPQSYALTTNTVGLVLYRAFDGTSYTLKPWLGQNVAVLTPISSSYQSNVMAQILSALDQAWVRLPRIDGQRIGQIVYA